MSPRDDASTDIDALRADWTELYRERLPSLARRKSLAQPKWSVQLDHCFARIILDAVVGRKEHFDGSHSCVPVDDEDAQTKAEPWTSRLKSPAIQKMSIHQLQRCISLGHAIEEGKINLVELDERSLQSRGKKQKTSSGQKREHAEDNEVLTSKIKKQKSGKAAAGSAKQQTLHNAFGLASPIISKAASVEVAPVPSDLALMINSSTELTPFRRQVLLAICQIPPGYVSTYALLATYLHSSPRAVGNALRNNPFAPRVPCHRIVAAGGKAIGGFGGGWGVEGKYFNEKVALLEKEGVSVDKDKDGRVPVSAVWDGFVGDVVKS